MGDFHTQPEAAPVRQHTPTPWELIEATEHHGAYVVNSWGRTVCDLYAMSNPMSASVRNGGNSYPVHFDDMEANASFIVEAVNSHATLKSNVQELTWALEAVNHTLTIHGHIDAETPLHERIRRTLSTSLEQDKTP